MIDRKQMINKEPIKYMHCKGCTRNYVSAREKKKLIDVEKEIEV
jgi:hypothetical protein